MALRLRAVGDSAMRLRGRARVAFGVNGGRLGRAPDNDWVIPDAERWVSAYHAEIEHRGGQWLLRDLSTNGTFVNGGCKPLGPGGTHTLESGDRLRIGDYEIDVDISDGNDFLEDEHVDPDHSPGTPAKIGSQPAARDAPRVAAIETDAPLPSAVAEQQLWPGIQALCKGAGLDPATLTADQRSILLQHAGQLLREVVLGFVELSRTRGDFLREFGVAPPSTLHQDGTPSARAPGVDDGLRHLLALRGPAAQGAVGHMRSNFAAIRHHEQALMAAMRQAVHAVLERLDPDEIEAQIGRGTRGASAPESGMRNWARYRETYRNLAHFGEGGLPPTFLQEFARSYRTFTSSAGAELDSSDTSVM